MSNTFEPFLNADRTCLELSEDEDIRSILLAVEAADLPTLEEVIIGLDDPSPFDDWSKEDDAKVAALFGRIETTSIQCYRGLNDVFADWVARGLFRTCKGLSIEYSGLKDDAIEALAKAGPYPSLTALTLIENKLRKKGIVAIAESGAFPALQRLDLSNNKLGAAAKGFAKATGLDALTSLRLSSCDLKKSAMVALLQLDWPHLRSLSISHNQGEADDARAALSSARLPHVERLHVGSLVWTDELDADPFAADSLPNVTWLDVSNTLTREGGRSLLTSEALPQLQSVTVSGDGSPTSAPEEVRKD